MEHGNQSSDAHSVDAQSTDAQSADMDGGPSERITCLGDCLVDFLPQREGEDVSGFSLHVGGAILNVAVGLGRLGVPVAFAGKVSADFFGARIRSRLAAEGVDTRFLLASERPTTLAFVVRQHPEPEYLFYGEATADTQLRADEMPPAFFTETALLHIGSTSLLRGTTPAAILTLARRLKGRALLSLDPNIRPSLIADEAAYRALLRALLALADLVKLSEADLAWLVPGADTATEARRLLDLGPQVVVVTRGERGVFALTRAGLELSLPAFAVPVVDTVGAGDALAAGLLAGLWRAGVRSEADLAALPAPTLAEVLREASAVAALTCAVAGANPPRLEIVESFLRQTGDQG